MTADLEKWFQFAVQQLFAESHLDGINWESGPQVLGRLQNGNTHPAFPPNGHTRVPAAQGEELVPKYKIIAHHANDGTGFSGTLLRWTNDQEETEYTLSLRSTEYKPAAVGGDRERDHLSGANWEIVQRGFALGQLAALEDFYEKDVLPLIGPAKLNVTGYSLGAHLATVFTEMHAERIKETVVFNAAGRGEFFGAGGTTAERITEMIQHFRTVLRSEPDASAYEHLSDADPGKSAYRYRYLIAHKAYQDDPDWNPFAPGTARAYDDPRYLWALAEISDLAGFTTVGVIVPRTGLSSAGDQLITSIYGRAVNADQQFVANSQVHASRSFSVLIEGQPKLEVSPSEPDMIDSSSVEGQPTTEADSFGPDSFEYGNTHSITLLVDSLALQRAFMRIDPKLTQEAVERIIKAASASKARITAVKGEAGAVESDSLERALFALARAFDPSAVQVSSLDTPGGFSELANRQAYFEQLASLPQQGTFDIEVLVGRSAAEIAKLAKRNDDVGKAVRYALLEPDPFAVIGGNYSDDKFPNGELNIATPDDPRGMSSVWIDARARLLEVLLRYNSVNGDLSATSIGGYYEERDRGFAMGSTLLGGPHYIFAGSDGQLPLVGSSRADFLIGGPGDDLIQASGGSDHVDAGDGSDVIHAGSGADVVLAGAGMDEIYGEDGNDTIYGGPGDDRIEGGAGNDTLEGGPGFDTYVYGDGDGFDTLADKDGLGQILYHGRILTGGARIGPRTFEDGAGTRYQLITEIDSSTTLVIDGAMSIKRFQSGHLGIVLEDADYGDPNPPPIGATRNYSQLVNGLPSAIPYPEGTDFATDPLAPFVNAYGSNASDSFAYASNENGLLGFYGRAGDDVVTLSGGLDGITVDGGAGRDLIDASLSSRLEVPVWSPGPIVLAGGGGDDYLLGGAGDEVIWGDNYLIGTGGPIAGRPSPSIRVDRFEFNVAEFLGWDESNTDADTLALLRNAAAMSFIGPFEGGAMPRQVYTIWGVDELIRYLELEGWLFDGVPTALDYMLGVDASFDDYIDGGSGDDTIHGGAGSDTIYGGEGNDTIDADPAKAFFEGIGSAFGDLAERFGDFGDDFIDGGDGDDEIVDATGGNDRLYGGAGNDHIRSEEKLWKFEESRSAFNQIYGGDGNDLIEVYNEGEGSFDIVDGEAGDDVIFLRSLGSASIRGGAGNDIINVDLFFATPTGDPADSLIGAGDFRVDGDDGDDTYAVFAGTISDPGGEDTIRLQLLGPEELESEFLYWWARGERPSALEQRVYQDGGNLVIADRSSYFGREIYREIVIEDWFVGATAPIEHVRFESPRITLDSVTLESWGGNFVGNDDGQHVRGTDYTDRVLAGGGADEISTGEGNDLIAGGAGDDWLDGGAGDDAYFYALGDGDDVVVDEAGLDRLIFGAGISAADLAVEIVAEGAKLHIGDGVIEIAAAGSGMPGLLAIEIVIFEDGSEIEMDQLVAAATAVTGGDDDDLLVGNGLANDIRGGQGDDFLVGGAGDDIYHFALGDGVDAIDDVDSPGDVNTVLFGPGISADMLSLGSGSLIVYVGPAGDAIHLMNVDVSDVLGVHDIELFRFADGSQLTYQELVGRGLAVFGTRGDDVLFASNLDDRVRGGPGDDLLIDGEGDDIYFFARGDGVDTIVDAYRMISGNDTLVFSDDISVLDVSVAASDGDIILLVGNGEGGVVIRSGALYDVIEQIQFHEGTTWSGSELREMALDLSNHAPLAGADSAVVMEDVQLTVSGNVLENDTDVDIDDALSVASAGSYPGTYGVLLIQASGDFAYQLDNEGVQFLGEGERLFDRFAYSVTDGIAIATGALDIEIIGTNDAPYLDKALTDVVVRAGTEFSFAISADTFIDIDAGDTLSFAAFLADGEALPAWIRFDESTQQFSGVAPGSAGDGEDGCDCGFEDGGVAAIDVTIVATDVAGMSATGSFAITIDGQDGAGVGWPIFGTQRGDLIHGTDGDDVIDGRGGGDKMMGGAGDDIYFVDATGPWGDEVIERAQEGYDSVYAAASYELPNHVEELHLLGSDNLWGRGNAGANVIVGNTGGNRLYGMAGSDLLLDDEGADLLDGGDGDDVLDGGSGNDTLLGGKGNDLYVHALGGGHDEVRDTGGLDTVRFGEGIAPTDIHARRSNADLVLILAGGRESVTLKEWFASSSQRVERVEFADGTVWSEATLRSRVSPSTPMGEADFEDDRFRCRGEVEDRGLRYGHAEDHDNNGWRRGRVADDDPMYDAIATRLRAGKEYDFTALAAYLQRGGNGGYGAMTPAEIANRWVKVQACVAAMAPAGDDCPDGHGGHCLHVGFAHDDGPHRGGWGHAGSTGQSTGWGGLQSFGGLREGFHRL